MLMRRQVSSNWLAALMARLRRGARSGRGATAVTLSGPPQWPSAETRHLAPERARLLLAVSEYLRQPFYALSLASEGVLRNLEQAPGSAALPQMRASLSSLDDRIDALGLIASLDSGSLHPERVDFSVQPLLDRLDVAFGHVAIGKGLRWDVTPSLARVRSNPVLLERMLANLVDNAIRFTTTGGVVVSSRLSGSFLLLQVWDTGLGIDPLYHGRIFEAFFRDAPDGDRGAGLGLPIVQSGARVLGIDVSLRSVPGRGSCFSMRVPMVRDAVVRRSLAAAVLSPVG
ncbi:HAMP domain-containing sensor histidine kinase [Hydrogenophaga sp. 2FB]|uniref:sensor histidine kinase n=1 Tax=Hydrogenophaga sp. 2FB TaxID=2502187 RepID=UPI0010F4D176|nr:HAMP domain-containing sensor histidine kinase [Hydrogenophaga sp. 2FB]